MRAFEPAWGGSGGGVSIDFPIPSYQSKVSGVASTTMRNVPDVAYDADDNLCADLYVPPLGQRQRTPIQTCEAGTGTGTQAWTGFIALAGQARAKAGKKPLTDVETRLYAIAKSGGTL